MLFTRCPDCRTTFRITADALRKAGGQVRCGRCASVFDAYAALHGTGEELTDAESQALLEAATRTADAEAATAASPDDPAAASPDDPAAALPDDPAAALADDPAPPLSGAGAPSPSTADTPSTEDAQRAGRRAARRSRRSARKGRRPAIGSPAEDKSSEFGEMTVANVVEQLESSRVEDEPEETAAAGALAGTAESLTASPAWMIVGERGGAGRTSRRWLFASAAAAVLLAGQATHYFRAQIAGVAIVGPILEDAYAMIGTEVVPHWDVQQYQIVDWVEITQPDSSGQGSLKIAARVRNNGPRRQPFPHVHVRLKDRWEEEIGSRIFEPIGYLPKGANPDRMMAPGNTARAELEVVDPGPDAYGFELDICVQADDGEHLRCAADIVFR